MSRRSPSPIEPTPLRDLPPEEDLVGAGDLIRAAVPASDITTVARQRIRARLRSALTAGTERRTRWRLRLHPLLVVLTALVSASVGGAAVQSMIAQRRLQRDAVDREPQHAPGGAQDGRPRRARRVAGAVAPAPASPGRRPLRTGRCRRPSCRLRAGLRAAGRRGRGPGRAHGSWRSRPPCPHVRPRHWACRPGARR